MVEKLVKDGKVAILVSPGFGAGWSTWSNENAEAMLFDPDIVRLVIDKSETKNIIALARTKWPNEYFGGAEDLTVAWIDQGSQFEIREYDGSESLHYIGPQTGYIA